jgi:predicted anti-sigma-YlaC factor YlaD
MNCESYQESLSTFIDGGASEHDATSAFQHLTECKVCRSFFRSTIELKHSLRAMPEPDIPTKVDHRILQIPAREKAWKGDWLTRLTSLLQRRLSVPLPAAAGAVSFLLIALGFSFWLLTRPGLVPQQQIIYVVSTPPVEVYGVRTLSGNAQQ